jgi:hypothetical protein
VPYDFQPYFNRFVGDVLPLDPARVDRINGAWVRLHNLISGDSAFAQHRAEMIVQGSYASGTAIRPVRAADEFDVDVVVKLTLPASWSSTDTLDWLAGRLAQDGVLRPRLTQHPRCVRVSYAGDFHVDVVPARRARTTSPISGASVLARLKVPDRAGGWRFSNPDGFVRWCAAQNRRTGGDFVRLVMMLKRWRDNGTADKRRVKSIVFTTLIGQSVPAWRLTGTSRRPDADVLVATLRTLGTRLRSFQGVPIVLNPSQRTENLSRTWTQRDFQSFRKDVRDAHRLAIQLHNGEDPEAWQILFGATFPKTPQNRAS